MRNTVRIYKISVFDNTLSLRRATAKQKKQKGATYHIVTLEVVS